ncbi:hypothetical protein IQ07DRAFT_617248 [Pyrenochaeta sp. DS3sAY3a]|nr:hypothetical protein IQ07DRAFT_617248 [Pyrenochaeta sp. DS3sAY3a]
MAPIDRREHRQQRVRGAGPSSVQASFGFNFGALATQAAKHSSLPPQRSSRRTPVRETPRAANGSTQRRRSASVQRSGSMRKSTPKDRTVTPKLGKRKRGSSHAPSIADAEEQDELSPDHGDLVRSIEQSRRIVGTVSPIHEEFETMVDELSMLDEGGSAARKSTLDATALMNGTPLSVLAKKRTSTAGAPQKTPIANRIGSMSVTSRRSISRRSRSTDPAPVTPAILPNGRPRTSTASRFGPEFYTPSAAPAEEESEDELSPPQTNGATPRFVAKGRLSQLQAQDQDAMDIDELSSPMEPTPIQTASTQTSATKAQQLQTPTLPSARRGRPRRVVEDAEANSIDAVAAVEPTTRGKSQRGRQSKISENHATPVASKSRRGRKPRPVVEEEADDEIDELSPEINRSKLPRASFLQSKTRVEAFSDPEDASHKPEESVFEEEEEEQEEEVDPTPQPIQRHQPPKVTQHAKTAPEKPPKKRQKFSGIKHAISVMRIKGSTVKGITVADTTRTILEETIDNRLNCIVEKLQASSDSAQRKDLRSQINLSLSFKESLNEKLLNLQDANDVLSTNFKKMKLFKRDNAELRKEILALQNNRQEVALEHDDIQAQFDVEKAVVETRNTISTNMFDIEAAIQNGRDKAKREQRESEGPDIPLTMLLDTVGKDVGSTNGGLLKNVQVFNTMLEKAADWLEGRV